MATSPRKTDMPQPGPLIRHVSDTARWVAVYRAGETSRPDALFRDPFAERLAGAHGEQIARLFPFTNRDAWPFAMRTYLFDKLIAQEIERGADMVINLAAGLDARPYRMALPPKLKWIEVDLPEVLAYKEEVLAAEKPVCELRRVPLDLSDVNARRKTFQELGDAASKVLIVSEGLTVYLAEEEVGKLAQDLSVPAAFHGWITDLVSPALLRMLQKKIGAHLHQAPLKFAPQAGPAFFEPYGWKAAAVYSTFKAAAQMKRLPFFWQIMSKMLPQSDLPQGNRPWSGVCLFTR